MPTAERFSPSDYGRLVEALPMGKRLPDAVYVHASALAELPRAAWPFVERARVLAGIEHSEFDVLKFSRSEPKISLLAYPTFFEDGFPALRKGWVVDLDKKTVQPRAYGEDGNPPILHRKELLLPEEHPARPDFEALTRSVEAYGLFENPREIGTLVPWQARKMGPPHVGELELITLDELREIRRIWVVEKHEIEDWLPAIYQQATGESFPGEEIRRGPFGAQELAILERECGEGFLQYEMLRNLLDTEHKYRTSLRRSRIFEDLEQVIRRCFYDSVEDATERARERERASNPGEPSVSPGAEKALEEKEPALPGLAAAASSRAGL